jgi:hypothetical protein
MRAVPKVPAARAAPTTSRLRDNPPPLSMGHAACRLKVLFPLSFRRSRGTKYYASDDEKLRPPLRALVD